MRPQLDCPVLPEGSLFPGSLIGIGRNFRDIGELTARSESRLPLVFGKFANSVIEHGAPILVPDGHEVVCEGELALVVGHTLKNAVTDDQALGALAGVCLANDVSARDIQEKDIQSTRGKSLDTFCPLGPTVVPLSDLPDLSSLMITTAIDGGVVQRASLSQMWFSPAELVRFCSGFMTLHPGDVILTGTPNVADESVLRLKPGMRVDVSIEGVGTLSNPVLAG